MELDSYTFVLLKRGPRAADFSDEELEHYQAAHLAHLAAMREAGKMVAAGSFTDQPDESLRGFCLYSCPLEEARELAGRDPSVRAGRMAVELMTWWTPRGSVGFHPV
jgi:uncharacterized protein YciI